MWFSASGSGVVGSNFRCPGLIVNLRKLEHGFRRISAMIPYTLRLYLKGMRILMFQFSGIYYKLFLELKK